MANDIMPRLNEAIATAQMQCEDGYFHVDEWDMVISEKLYNELKEECNEIYFTSVGEIQCYNGVSISIVPNWLFGSKALSLVHKKGDGKVVEISF